MNKINFITGTNYTLSELFSDEGKIIIPDLQRDYCWGDEVHTKNKIELVRVMSEKVCKILLVLALMLGVPQA